MEQSTANEIISRLEAAWPRWQIWIVHRVVGGPVYCARPWEDHDQVLNAGSPDELAEYLADADPLLPGPQRPA